jgi:hypothetical protein
LRIDFPSAGVDERRTPVVLDARGLTITSDDGASFSARAVDGATDVARMQTSGIGATATVPLGQPTWVHFTDGVTGALVMETDATEARVVFSDGYEVTVHDRRCDDGDHDRGHDLLRSGESLRQRRRGRDRIPHP